MAKQRTPERAAKILDRAARMSSFKPGILDRRLFDTQMRTPGHVNAPFNINKVAQAGILTPAGRQDIPLSKIRTEQPTISLAAAKANLTNPTTKGGSSPVVVQHKGLYYVGDGNHRITAARALGEKSISVRVMEINGQIRQPALNMGSVGKSLGHLSAFAGPAVVAANATMAYKARINDGGSTAEAAGAAAVEGTKTAATGMAIGGAVKAASNVGLLKGTAAAIGRAAVPLSMAAHAGGYAFGAWRRGEDNLGIMKAAGWGAINGVVPFDLTAQAVKAWGDSGRADTATPARLTSDQAAKFQTANASFNAGSAHAQQQGDAGTDPTGKRVGWSDKARAASAAARGVKWTGPTE